MTAEEVGRACFGFETMWFQSSHITSHMTEKKKKERVMEKKRNSKRRGRADQNKQQLKLKHTEGILHVLKLNNS